MEAANVKVFVSFRALGYIKAGTLWIVMTSRLRVVVVTVLVLGLLLCACQSAHAIPAFARKYSLPCSACHEAWPKLNDFGIAFRDRGYQLGNEKDSPIWQNPSYWPITMRITPQWHRESSSAQVVDTVPGNPALGQTFQNVTTHGFDFGGVDIWTAGTLYKDISFSLLPSSDSSGSFHFENVFVRFDNLFRTRWVNVKFGKFELDNLVSEKRMLFLSKNGGFYQVYHYMPFREAQFRASNPPIVQFGPAFGIGDNQLGVELSGHSANSYTRYSVAILSSNEGNPGLPNHTYDAWTSFNHGFQVGKLGVQRIGAFAYFGQRPTFFNTSLGSPVLGQGLGNKSFYRTGVTGLFYIKKLDFSTVFVHGWDNAFLGTGTAANVPLPGGARAPTWNGGFVETHFTYSPQLVFVQRNEIVRMSRQVFSTDPQDLGDVDAFSFGLRYYPFMFSRAGLALHTEYSIVRSYKSASPLPTSSSPFGPDLWASSVLVGLDFAF
jgi:hypothetical protein